VRGDGRRPRAASKKQRQVGKRRFSLRMGLRRLDHELEAKRMFRQAELRLHLVEENPRAAVHLFAAIESSEGVTTKVLRERSRGIEQRGDEDVHRAPWERGISSCENCFDADTE